MGQEAIGLVGGKTEVGKRSKNGEGGNSAVSETVRLCFALSRTELPVAKKGLTLTY